MAILWNWIFERIVPDKFDMIGAAIALVGVGIIFYTPRKGGEESIWSSKQQQ